MQETSPTERKCRINARLRMKDFDFFYTVVLLLPLFLTYILVRLYLSNKKRESSSPVFLVIWNLGLTLGLLTLVFLAGETYFRFFVDETDSFGLKKTCVRWLKENYLYNNVNCRDDHDYVLQDVATNSVPDTLQLFTICQVVKHHYK